jgi:hypothetical protein
MGADALTSSWLALPWTEPWFTLASSLEEFLGDYTARVITYPIVLGPPITFSLERAMITVFDYES